VLGTIISIALSLASYKYLVLIISSPFMSLLSEKVEEIEVGHTETTWSLSSLFYDLIRGIRINVRNLFKEIFFTLLLMLAGLIPVIGILNTVAIFLVQAYYAGFGNIDFVLERHFGLTQSTAFVKRNRGFAIGIGTAFLLTSATVIGLIFAAPLATVAATRRLMPAIREESDLTF
ncbi:MAG: EI24 domain-containing protein, partial [Bacteroidia bacterium]|nr:EI24 domain-containing protein [Bacteroidia bacterium]